ncbi:hypothetical protein CLPUN_28660 [Clostridium puniceum]|uniref:DUF2752 domain-containing protein n=1 Tax=Clostridium puniceum TaxID=29367 RepID=A0A1S8TET9_9CLOT|nr:DUF2752 domain-containing protein [Clostridium puniceum]OOM76142.1 hypothetical protein CLPUN_28660 [Clostridium puniceum]
MKDIKINQCIKFGLAMVLLYIFYNIVGIGCPIKFFTGISCAGCGMTRAWIHLGHLDIRGAFHYHPLFFLPIIYLFLYLYKDKIPHKTFIYVVAIGITIFLIIYIFRLLNPDDIVNINIENGFIYKIFKFIRKGEF